MDEYSMLNPPEISSSASTRSNGARAISAVMATAKRAKGISPVWMMFQCQRKPPCWSPTMALVCTDPVTTTTVATVRPITAS